jgi:radical SAM superfamily enzyme YgiQ (UPF0313 family)
VRGEGEESLLQLVKRLDKNEDWTKAPGISYRANGEIALNPHPPLQDVDRLPFPARDTLESLFQTGNRVVTLSASRGCYMRCSFCSIVSFYQLSGRSNFRERSPENVADEIEHVISVEPVRSTNVPYFWFCDGEFIGPPQRGRLSHAEKVANEIIKLGRSS